MEARSAARPSSGPATNGSVAFAVKEFLPPDVVRIAPGWHRKPQSLAVGDWVEASGEESDLAGQVGTLARVVEVSEDEQSLVLDRNVSIVGQETHARLRRWNQRNGPTVTVSSDWIPLEQGIQVRFSEGNYRPGDYWTIPARPADAGIEWPAEQPPQGVEHQLCPLALIAWRQTGEAWTPAVDDCRRVFSPLTEIHGELAQLRSEVAALRHRPRPWMS